MPFSKKYNLCFIHIPKTAGTTIEKALNVLNKESLYSETKFKDKNVTAQHLTFKQIKEELKEELNSFDIFTITRNPFDRIVSEYNHIQYNDWANEYKNLHFDDFVYKAINTDIEKRITIFDAHIEPQNYFIEGCDDIHLFKYENLPEVFQWLNNKTNKNLNFGHERKSNRKPYKEYFNNIDTINLINSFYEQDLIKFRYKF